jgi:hypothetical protein
MQQPPAFEIYTGYGAQAYDECPYDVMEAVGPLVKRPFMRRDPTLGASFCLALQWRTDHNLVLFQKNGEIGLFSRETVPPFAAMAADLEQLLRAALPAEDACAFAGDEHEEPEEPEEAKTPVPNPARAPEPKTAAPAPAPAAAPKPAPAAASAPAPEPAKKKKHKAKKPTWTSNYGLNMCIVL